MKKLFKLMMTIAIIGTMCNSRLWGWGLDYYTVGGGTHRTSFAIITDIHGYSDRLQSVVNWINSNHTACKIQFVLTLGDYCGENLSTMKPILDGLDVPYGPLIGNHECDTWSEEKEFNTYFENQINSVFRSYFPTYYARGPCYVWNPETSEYDYFQNYTFDIEGSYPYPYHYHFVCLDFCSRRHRTDGDADLHNFTSGTTSWLLGHLNNYLSAHPELKGKDKVILVSHHPPTKFTLTNAYSFSASEYHLLIDNQLIPKHKYDIGYWFAGHYHRGEIYNVKNLSLTSTLCTGIETDALGECWWSPGDGRIRIVKIYAPYTGSGGGSGCPFIYIWNGERYLEDNNILHGSGRYEEDVLDKYKLTQPISEQDGRYLIEIRENEKEHSWIDKVSLLAVDHPKGLDVGVIEGNIIPYKWLSLPISCFDKEGNRRPDILELIKERDNKVFLGDSGDSLMIEFPQRGEIIALSVEEKEELGGLSVSGNNMEALYMSPRENFSTQLLYLSVDTFPLANGVTDSLTLTLKWNSYHPLDYISLVKRIDSPLTDLFTVEPCSLTTAIHYKNGKVEQKLLVSDQDYEELLPGDTIRLEFTVPPKLEPGWVRDFVLISNGYYITEGDGGAQTAYSNIPIVHFLSLYPNPARNDMTIGFGIPREERVSLKVYDVSGREIKTLVDGRLEAGYHTIRLDGKNLPSGIYFARLVTDGYKATKKLVLMK